MAVKTTVSATKPPSTTVTKTAASTTVIQTVSTTVAKTTAPVVRTVSTSPVTTTAVQQVAAATPSVVVEQPKAATSIKAVTAESTGSTEQLVTTSATVIQQQAVQTATVAASAIVAVETVRAIDPIVVDAARQAPVPVSLLPPSPPPPPPAGIPASLTPTSGGKPSASIASAGIAKAVSLEAAPAMKVAEIVQASQAALAGANLIKSLVDEASTGTKFYAQEIQAPQFSVAEQYAQPWKSLPDGVRTFVLPASANGAPFEADVHGAIDPGGRISLTVPYGTGGIGATGATLKARISYQGIVLIEGVSENISTTRNIEGEGRPIANGSTVDIVFSFNGGETRLYLLTEEGYEQVTDVTNENGATGYSAEWIPAKGKEYFAVVSVAAPPLPIQLRVDVKPDQALETASVLTNAGSVLIDRPQLFDIPVDLSSNDSTEVTVPSRVVIPAGQTKVSFDLTIVTDAEIDGPQLVTITASYPPGIQSPKLGLSIESGSDTIIITDSAIRQLTVDIPPSVILENVGTVSGLAMVTIPEPYVSGLDIALSVAGDGAQRVTLASSGLFLPAGATQVLFNFSIIDDRNINGDQEVIISASVPGDTSWRGGKDSFTLSDYIPPPPPPFTGKHYLVGFDNINVGLTEYEPSSIYISKSLEVKVPCTLALKVKELRPYIDPVDRTVKYTDVTYDTDDDNYFLGSIEYWIVREDYRGKQKIRTTRFPILPLGVKRIHHEVLPLPSSTSTYRRSSFFFIWQPYEVTFIPPSTYIYDKTKTYLNGTEFFLGEEITYLDTPNAGYKMETRFPNRGNIGDKFTLSYNPPTSTLIAVPSPPYSTYRTSLQPVIDLVGDLSARHLAENVIALDKLGKSSTADRTLIYLTIILRRNTSDRFISPAVDEYTLLVSNTDSTKFVEI